VSIKICLVPPELKVSAAKLPFNIVLVQSVPGSQDAAVAADGMTERAGDSSVAKGQVSVPGSQHAAVAADDKTKQARDSSMAKDEVPRPIRVSGMAKIAELAKPTLTFALKDERGEAIETQIDYGEDIRSNDDLVSHLSFEWIHRNLKSDEEGRLNVLLRLKAREEYVKRLRTSLTGQSPPVNEVISALKAVREELKLRIQSISQIRK
jgi:hypothetical protein